MTELEQHAAELAALGSPLRLAVLRRVVQGNPQGTPVGVLQSELQIPWSTLSHHLERLASAGLLRAQPSGRFVLYGANFERLRELTQYLWEDCCKAGVRSGCCADAKGSP